MLKISGFSSKFFVLDLPSTSRVAENLGIQPDRGESVSGQRLPGGRSLAVMGSSAVSA
jgi:hypothetical protein